MEDSSCERFDPWAPLRLVDTLEFDAGLTTLRSTTEIFQQSPTGGERAEAPAIVGSDERWCSGLAYCAGSQNPPGATPCEFDSRLGHSSSNNGLGAPTSRGAEPNFRCWLWHDFDADRLRPGCVLHLPSADITLEQLEAYFAALRAEFPDLHIRRRS